MKRRLIVIGATALALMLGAGETVAITICEWYHWAIPNLWGACILDAVIRFFCSVLIDAFVENCKRGILWTPNPASVNPLIQSYLVLMQPVFTLSILIVGFYLVFMSGSPGGRSRAKTMFWKLILAMALVSLSTEIYITLLNISQAISNKVLAGVTVDTISFGVVESVTFFIVQFVLLFIILLTVLSFGIRYILVLVTAALFPITIFLYLFDLPLIGAMGKETGAKLFRWTIGIIFAQVIQAIALAMTVVSFSSINEVTGWDGKLAAVFTGMAGFLMIACAPLIAMGVLKWIGGLMIAAGMGLSLAGHPALGFAVTAAGGLMMGQGPGSALMAAGGVASMRYALSMFQT